MLLESVSVEYELELEPFAKLYVLQFQFNWN